MRHQSTSNCPHRRQKAPKRKRTCSSSSNTRLCSSCTSSCGKATASTPLRGLEEASFDMFSCSLCRGSRVEEGHERRQQENIVLRRSRAWERAERTTCKTHTHVPGSQDRIYCDAKQATRKHCNYNALQTPPQQKSTAVFVAFSCPSLLLLFPSIGFPVGHPALYTAML